MQPITKDVTDGPERGPPPEDVGTEMPSEVPHDPHFGQPFAWAESSFRTCERRLALTPALGQPNER